MSARESAIKYHEEQIARLRAQQDPVYTCAKCGRTQEEVDHEPLTDVRVIVADGEEGFSDVTLLLCSEHLWGVCAGLQRFGFVDHRHGSTSSLESESCPGYENMDACPMPTRYGNVTWGRQPLQDEE